MKLKSDDHIDVKNLVTVIQLRPEETTPIIRMLVNEIEALKLENKALLDEVLSHETK